MYPQNRRGDSRFKVSLPALVYTNNKVENIKAQIVNLSNRGALIKCNSTDMLDTEFTIQFDIPNRLNSLIIPSKKLYCKDGLCGVQFSYVQKMAYNALEEFLNNHTKQFERREIHHRRKDTRGLMEDKRQCLERRHIKTFYLYIDGKNYDTGKYEYYPYQHKMWTQPKETLRIMHNAKKGIWKKEYEEYIYAKYCVGDDDANKKAIDSAYRASKQFKYIPLSVRRNIFRDIYRLLLKHKNDLINLMVIEGHPVKLATWEFLGMQTAYEKETLDFFKKGLRENIFKLGNETVYTVRRPDGVVCISPPKNAPCSNSFLGVFSILSGNTVVIKPPVKMPLSTIYLWKNVIQESLKMNGVSGEVINIVLGNSKNIMNEWIENPKVNDILYFGESTLGLEIGYRAYEKGKKAILELSGNDMMFIWKDADIEKAVESLLDSFIGSTQICMVPKKAIVHEKICDKFLSKFVEEAKKIKPFLPTHEEAVLSPVLKVEDFNNFLNDALEKGANLLCGGYKINMNNEKDLRGIFIAPTVLEIDGDKINQMKCIEEENFFPLIPIIKVKGKTDNEIFDKMKKMSESNKYGLRISAHVNSNSYIRKFIKYFSDSGLLRINSRHVGFSLGLSTHGGVKRTGGPYGEMNYVWQKTSHLQGITVARRIK
jgi:acyl-CoA reductase-like NAD-dependent aldehyde dehydrogenase